MKLTIESASKENKVRLGSLCEGDFFIYRFAGKQELWRKCIFEERTFFAYIPGGKLFTVAHFTCGQDTEVTPISEVNITFKI